MEELKEQEITELIRDDADIDLKRSSRKNAKEGDRHSQLSERY